MPRPRSWCASLALALMAISGLPATSYEQLLEIAALLLRSEAASVELVREGAALSRHDRRGD